METIITIPTDVGRSWYVVFLAFCQNFVKESVPYTFLMFIATHGKECDQELGLIIGGFYFGMYYLFSPLACALANWYSFTALNIVGPLIMTVSMIASHFVSSCEKYMYLLITYSVIGGFGCSMIHMSSKLMPSYWFCNRRQLAHSLAYSGQAFGFLFVPNIAQLIINQIHHGKMKNMFFFFAVLVLPLIALGVLTPKMPGVKIHFKRKDPGNKSPKVRFKDEVMAAMVSQDVDSIGNTTSFRVFKTHHNLIFPRVKDIIGESDITVYIPDKAMRRVLMRPFRHGTQPNHSQSSATTVVCNFQEVSMLCVEETQWNCYGARPMYRLDIFYTWALFNISLYYRQDNQLDYHLGVTRAVSRRDVLQEQYRRRVICPEAMLRTLLTMLDCRLASSVYYLMFQFNMFLISTGQIVPFVFLLSRAEECGLSLPSFFLVYAGLGQVFGRLLVTSYGLFSPITDFYNSTIFILCLGGFATCIAAFITSYYNLMFYSIVFGAVYAILQTFRLPVVYSIIKLSFLTNAIGHMLIMQAIASVFGISVSAVVPLRTLLRFAEDYNKIIVQMPQEFILTRAKSNINAVVVSTVDGDNAYKLTLNQVYWHLLYVTHSYDQKIKLYKDDYFLYTNL